MRERERERFGAYNTKGLKCKIIDMNKVDTIYKMIDKDKNTIYLS